MEEREEIEIKRGEKKNKNTNKKKVNRKRWKGEIENKEAGE